MIQHITTCDVAEKKEFCASESKKQRTKQ